ncbi:MAG TPA: hypothetical protein VLZ89_16385 [Anaerolineales bacterium]|nr:hypothetical protein [Anaerolineales bacterium]
MSWMDQLRGDPLPWLLGSKNANVRYLAQRDLLELPAEDRELRSARRSAHKEGPIALILSNMEKEGYWVRPGPGYNPKYRSTVWSLILLAQLGASVHEDGRIERACKYLLDHLADGGQFTTSTSGAPSGTVDCLQGNLCWSLMELGLEDPRLKKAYEWMAHTVTGDGLAPVEAKEARLRYYAYKCGPTFACGVNNRLPCAWGGVKVMLAFSKLPALQRTPLIRRAAQQGADFFFGIDPATAHYPTRDKSGKPSRDWWKFGFPVFYITDLLQLAEALVNLGFGRDKRLTHTLEIIREKQNEQGQWLLEFDYTGRTWLDFGARHQPNPWVTLRALRVLKAAG